MKISIDEIRIKEGRRSLDTDHVKELADSIRELGLLNPVTIDNENTLIAGLHRLEAVRRLGWTEVECTVSSLDGLQAELAEIDENIIRSGLSPVEYGEILLRRKEIYEALHPETKNGGDRKSGKIRSAKCTSDSEPSRSFVDDTAEKLGVNPCTVRRQIQTARNLTPEAKKIIKESETKLSKKAALKLSRLEPEEQKEAAALLAAKEIRDVEEYTSKIRTANVSQTDMESELQEHAKESDFAAGEYSLESKAQQCPLKEMTEQDGTGNLKSVTSFDESHRQTEHNSPEKQTVSRGHLKENDICGSNIKEHKFFSPESGTVHMQQPEKEQEPVHTQLHEQGTELPYQAGQKDKVLLSPVRAISDMKPQGSGMSLKEIIADLKDPDKDCSGTPDSFLQEYDAFVRKFHREIDWYSDPYYDTVYPFLTDRQLADLRRLTDSVISSVEELYRKVKTATERNRIE